MHLIDQKKTDQVTSFQKKKTLSCKKDKDWLIDLSGGAPALLCLTHPTLGGPIRRGNCLGGKACLSISRIVTLTQYSHIIFPLVKCSKVNLWVALTCEAPSHPSVPASNPQAWNQLYDTQCQRQICFLFIHSNYSLGSSVVELVIDFLSFTVLNMIMIYNDIHVIQFACLFPHLPPFILGFKLPRILSTHFGRIPNINHH